MAAWTACNPSTIDSPPAFQSSAGMPPIPAALPFSFRFFLPILMKFTAFYLGPFPLHVVDCFSPKIAQTVIELLSKKKKKKTKKC